MTAKLSFCLKAATTLGDQDLAAITDSIEAYARGGMDMRQAEAAAVDDVIAQVAAERTELVALVKEQHPEQFKSDRAPVEPPAAPAPAPSAPAEPKPEINLDKADTPDFADTEVLPHGDVVEESRADEADVAAVAKVEAGLKAKAGDTFKSLQMTAMPRLSTPGTKATETEKSQYAAAQLMERIYGKRVIWFSSNTAFANGLMASYFPDTIFVNVASTRPVMAVMGHEMLHALRTSNEALYQQLSNRLRALLEEPGRYHDALATKYRVRGIPALTFDKTREELIADIVGDFHTEPQFWNDLAAGQPALFQRVLGAVREFFNQLLRRLKSEKPYGAEKYLNDVRAARAAVVEAMGDFAANQRATAVPADVAWTALSANADPFYSELGRHIATAPMNQGTAQAWKQALKGLQSKGVKADEIAWTGIEDWLDLQEGKITRDQVLEYLRGNGVQVTETVLWQDASLSEAERAELSELRDLRRRHEAGERGVLDRADVIRLRELEHGSSRPQESEAKYHQYTLPGGTNYREVLLTLPGAAVNDDAIRAHLMRTRGLKRVEVENISTAMRDTARDEMLGLEYRSSHWDQPNVLAHIRLNDRTDADGKKVLFVEEIQSDWAQQGKKNGFKTDVSPKEFDEAKRAILDAQNDIEELNNEGQAATKYRRELREKYDRTLDESERHPVPERRAEAMQAMVEQEKIRDREAQKAREFSDRLHAANETLKEAKNRLFDLEKKSRGVPLAPFVGKTDAWVALALKRVIKMAVDGGYDRVAIVNGQQSADRYDLSKQIASVQFLDNSSGGIGEASMTGEPGRGSLIARDHNGKRVVDEQVMADQVEDYVGKEVARKLFESEPRKVREAGIGFRGREVSGLDLKVGGEGMTTFYDQIVPKVAKDVVRKLGGEGLVPISVMAGVRPTGNLSDVDIEAVRDYHDIGQATWAAASRQQQNAMIREYLEGGGNEEMTPQLGFDITDSMREKAAGGLPMFSLPDYTDEQRAALAKAGIDTRTRLQRAGDRIRAFYPRIAAQVQSNWARQFQQGFIDQFTGMALAVQNELGGLPVDQDPVVAARLANGGTSSVMRGLLLHGQARWAANKQHLEKIPGTKGLLEILEPLGPDVNDFFGWMIGHRAARLMAEGRENNFTEADIAALKALGAGKEAQFRAAALQYAAFKRSVLDIAQQAGLIDAESRKVWDQADYIPFYRQIDEKAVFGATGKKGLAGQSSGIRQLRGGEAALNDPMENIIMNFSRLIDASLKNNALLKTVYLLQEAESDVVKKVGYAMSKELIPADQVRKVLEQAGTLPAIIDMIPAEAFDGMAKMWAIQAPTSPDVVRVMNQGKPEFYQVNDQLLLKALTSFVPFDFPGLGLMRAFKRLLTGAVTATPEFMIRNFIRDSVATQMVGKDGINPLKSITGIVKSYTEAGGFEAMLFAGASFQSGQINAGDPVATAKAARRALRKKGFAAASQDISGTILDTPQKFWEAYRHVGEAIENANREAVYEATLKAGKSPTAAAFESKDLMDFTLRGSSPIYQVMADVLPFFNARVQGLYRLGRANPKRLATYGLLMLAASVMLVLANGDNPEYDQLPDWDKDTYWHVWIGGKHFRIPKPFELGVAFATLPERVTQYVKGHDSGKKLISRVFANIRDQLAIDPIPQLLRPGLNAAYNHDSFRDRPIETMSDEGKLPSRRFGPYTSATARKAVDVLNVHVPGTSTNAMDAIGLSPKKLEYLVGGYLGTTGLYALGLSDMAVKAMEGAPPSPKPRMDDYPVIRSFYRMEPARATQFESDFYELRTHIEQVYKTIMAEAKDGNIEKAAALRDQNIKQLAVRDAVADVGKRLTLINKARDNVYLSREMTPLAKRTELDRLQMLKNDLLRRAMKQPAIMAAQ